MKSTEGPLSNGDKKVGNYFTFGTGKKSSTLDHMLKSENGRGFKQNFKGPHYIKERAS